MGYCMNCREVEFFMKEKNKQDALVALKELSMSQGLRWTHQDGIEESTSLEDALEECRWETEVDENDNIVTLCFIGEKLGSDKEIFDSIAPFVEDGSYIEMGGEDGEFWRWCFKDGKCVEVSPKIEW